MKNPQFTNSNGSSNKLQQTTLNFKSNNSSIQNSYPEDQFFSTTNYSSSNLAAQPAYGTSTNKYLQNFEEIEEIKEQSQIPDLEIIGEFPNEESQIRREKTRQLHYILPHYIPSYWRKVQPQLARIAEGKCSSNPDNLYDSLRQIIKAHYQGPKNIDIGNLKKYLESHLSKRNQQQFMTKLAPFIAQLALQVKFLFKGEGIKMLLSGRGQQSVGLTQYQVSCLLANMFLCTTHEQTFNLQFLNDQFNFSEIFRAGDGYKKYNQESVLEPKIEKIQCLVAYFDRIRCEGGASQNLYVTYKRLKYRRRKDQNKVVDDLFWRRCDRELSKVHILKKGEKIQEDSEAIQIDFANQFIGGGVLGHGLAQQEIRFLVSPELIPSLLIFERMEDDEAFLAIGTQRYSTYSGYRGDFEYRGPIHDKLQENTDLMHLKSYVVGIDALNFSQTISPLQSQFFTDKILRQLVKAYVGFCGSEDQMGEASASSLINEGAMIGLEIESPGMMGFNKEKEKESQKKLRVATGQWGCGVFQGDEQVQFILQWLAASVADRDVNYYVFESEEDEKSQISFEFIVQKLTYLNQTVGDVYIELSQYAQVIKSDQIQISLFQYLQDFVRY